MINQIDLNRFAAVQNMKQSKPAQPQSSRNMTPEQKELMKACQGFEAMMIRQMFEVMQSSQKMFGNGFGGDYFQSMFQDEMSKKIAENGQGIGLANMMYQQLTRTTVKKADLL
jgi:flagellar protein FlgJ